MGKLLWLSMHHDYDDISSSSSENNCLYGDIRFSLNRSCMLCRHDMLLVACGEHALSKSHCTVFCFFKYCIKILHQLTDNYLLQSPLQIFILIIELNSYIFLIQYLFNHSLIEIEVSFPRETEEQQNIHKNTISKQKQHNLQFTQRN